MTTITKADIVGHLQEGSQLPVKTLKQLVDKLFERMKIVLEKGEEIKLSGFGKFYVRDKQARPGRNPRTGEEVMISARRVVCFRAGDKLRENLEAMHSGARDTSALGDTEV